MRQCKTLLSFALAAVTCPCHLPVLLALLAGTGARAVLAAHAGVLFAAMALLFVSALACGAGFANRDAARVVPPAGGYPARIAPGTVPAASGPAPVGHTPGEITLEDRTRRGAPGA